MSAMNPGSCENVTWSSRHVWGEDTFSLLRFSAEWLGETCRSLSASSYQRFLLDSKPVLVVLPGGADVG